MKTFYKTKIEKEYFYKTFYGIKINDYKINSNIN